VFNLSPQTPRVGETVTFTSAAADDVALPAATATGPVTWDLDNDGAFDDGTGNSVKRAYGEAGDRVVRMRVVDSGGLATIGTKTFPVQQFLPTASFTSSPAHPLPGQTVTFKSNSSPSPGAQITKQEWDFDGISGIDATGAQVTTIYRTAGRRTVTLKVTDTQGFDIATAPVAVNAPPSAAFRMSPTQPYVGDSVTFASVSGDPDGPLPTEAWDLDGDGQYDDATGKTASRTFTTAGAHTVRLRVQDSVGAAGAAALTINVRPRPVSPPGDLPQLAARVRVTSEPGRKSTLIRTLRVRAPRGATVKVRCIGRGCPKRGASSTRSKGKVMRVKWLQHRLRAGTRITISVTRKGYIGSFTALVVRRSKGISRDDLCLVPGKKKPRTCPS
jgi:PKD repeat protein